MTQSIISVTALSLRTTLAPNLVKPPMRGAMQQLRVAFDREKIETFPQKSQKSQKRVPMKNSLLRPR